MQTFANNNVYLLLYFYYSQIIDSMMVVDAGSRGPLWIFSLGPQQTAGNTAGQGADGAGAPEPRKTQVRTPATDICPYYAFSES